MVVDEFVTERLCRTVEMYQERCKRALKNDHRIQSNRWMIYECEDCHAIYLMQLEEGLEDQATNRKPVPFTITCIACSGLSKDVRFYCEPDSKNVKWHSYFESLAVQNTPICRNFFWNNPDEDCGVPVLFEPDLYNYTGRTFEDVFSPCLLYVEKDVQNTMELLDFYDSEGIFAQNRKQRRHPEGHESWKRPRKNKKLYEY